jgi:Tfp pilus assembly protein PilO
MKNLSREKKQQLLLVALGTLGVLSGLWFGLISAQKGKLVLLEARTDAAQIKLKGMQDTIARSEHINTEVSREAERLQQAESQMASGDLYAWIINTIRDFRTNYDVDIPQFSTILTGKTTLLAGFPYSQVKLTVAGTAYYHDLGRFIADFENRFPYMRFENLQLEPAPSGSKAAAEKLAFRLDVVALVRPEA